MGEYADEYFRKEVMDKYGFDPESMYPKKPKKPKKPKVTRREQCKGTGGGTKVPS